MEIPYEKTIADLFRWRVSESGDEIAHKFLDSETTYKELDSYAKHDGSCCLSAVDFVVGTKD